MQLCTKNAPSPRCEKNLSNTNRPMVPSTHTKALNGTSNSRFDLGGLLSRFVWHRFVIRVCLSDDQLTGCAVGSSSERSSTNGLFHSFLVRTTAGVGRMGESNLGTMFAGFAKRATALGQSVSKTAAEKAAMIAETVTAHSRIHMDYEVAAEVGQCGPEGMWKIHRARPIKNGELFSLWSNPQYAPSLLWAFPCTHTDCALCSVLFPDYIYGCSQLLTTVHRCSNVYAGAVKSVSVWILNKAVLQQYAPLPHRITLHQNAAVWPRTAPVAVMCTSAPRQACALTGLDVQVRHRQDSNSTA